MDLGSFGKEVERRPSSLKRLPLLFVLCLAVLALLFWLAGEREKPQVTFTGDISYLGFVPRQISLTASDTGSGLQLVETIISQEGKRIRLLEKTYPKEGFFPGAGPKRITETLLLNAKTLGFKDGPANLQVKVSDFSWWNWLRGNITTVNIPLLVDTMPPALSLLEVPKYIKAGGAGVVVYRISEPPGRHGVLINEIFYPGVPLPKKGEGVYAACLGLPFDLTSMEKILVAAEDKTGNEARMSLSVSLHPRKIKSDKIAVSDAFLAAKLPEFATYYPDLSGTPVEQFLRVNGEIRRANYEKIKEICGRFSPERLWDGRFVRMEGSPKAGYADRRTYVYERKEIDSQVHLGVDIASTQQAPVPAANRGKVVLAEYLGIYGNTVILDHGQGIFSLYSHLSRIDAQVGTILDKGTPIGLSGATGMAGGDHLHFSMLVNGVFVDPVEWWDEEWLKLHMLNVL